VSKSFHFDKEKGGNEINKLKVNILFVADFKYKVIKMKRFKVIKSNYFIGKIFSVWKRYSKSPSNVKVK
jgi:hypothetical protein